MTGPVPRTLFDKIWDAHVVQQFGDRNFEGRQGPGGRTHLVSPAMAAAAAVPGRLVDARELG